ncbi:MAG TPA: 2-amino-4-hydroxy-6-hydroxymethyldihydropteridine diphosphokinase [Alphaproteobacteria bacterium]|nr:2-amino-4-hydroxy-6-hydroxymethyldihydropteridine diphosphokinase [Alphaproteobacteria bacterium]
MMILVAIGSNLPHPLHGPPLKVAEAALAALEAAGIRVAARSPWYETRPVPVSDQPWYVNGVAAVRTDLPPPALLARLHGIEADFGRVRSVANAARILDLDLIAYGDAVSPGPAPILPHPRMHERAFVLLPLRDIAPDWRHPITGAALDGLIAALPPDQAAEPLRRDP